MTFSSLTLAWATIIAGVAALFTIADQSASNLTKDAVRDWLRNVDPEKSVSGLPDTFIRVFDNFFGEKHLSWKCFVRSFISSFSCCIILTLIWLIMYDFNGQLEGLQFDTGLVLIVFAFILFLLINSLPDYLSLLETRYLLYHISAPNNKYYLFAAIISDVIFTGLCFFIGLFFFIWLINSLEVAICK